MLLFYCVKAILKDEREVSAWLDHARVPLQEAVTSLIMPKNCLRHHPVSRSLVGDVKNKTEDCVKPIDIRLSRNITPVQLLKHLPKNP